jgi:hypothetical protein
LPEIRPVVYALLDFTLDEATPIVGLLAEINRRIHLAELVQPSNH